MSAQQMGHYEKVEQWQGSALELLAAVGGVEYAGVGISDGIYRKRTIFSRPLAQPAAGADFSIQVPSTAGNLYRIAGVVGTFTASGNVANRILGAVIKDGAGNEVYTISYDANVTASTVVTVCLSPQFATVVGGITDSKVLGFPIPAGPLLPRWTIGSLTGAIDASDQWSSVAVWGEQLSPVS